MHWQSQADAGLLVSCDLLRPVPGIKQRPGKRRLCNYIAAHTPMLCAATAAFKPSALLVPNTSQPQGRLQHSLQLQRAFTTAVPQESSVPLEGVLECAKPLLPASTVQA